MARYTKIIKSGCVLEIEVFYSKEVDRHVPRTVGCGMTPPDQQRRNYYNAVKRLSRKLNANFTRDDLFLTLTYEAEPSEAEAERAFKQFLRNIRAVRRIRHLPELKYVAVTENTFNKKKRTHHHIVMSKMSVDEINDIWEHGIVISSRLRKSGDYAGLAHYITKEPKREHKKRWSQSKGLAEPVVTYEKVSRAKAQSEINTPQGYRQIYQVRQDYDDFGMYRYAKFVKLNEFDIAIGNKEIPPEEMLGEIGGRNARAGVRANHIAKKE